MRDIACRASGSRSWLGNSGCPGCPGFRRAAAHLAGAAACGAGLPGSPNAAKSSLYESVLCLAWRTLRWWPMFLCRILRRLRVTSVQEAMSTLRERGRQGFSGTEAGCQ